MKMASLAELTRTTLLKLRAKLLQKHHVRKGKLFEPNERKNGRDHQWRHHLIIMVTCRREEMTHHSFLYIHEEVTLFLNKTDNKIEIAASYFLAGFHS